MTSAQRILLRASCLCFFILHPSAFSLGEEIAWRTDYGKARKEAADKGRPLVIDMTTDDCFWCKQLDARTFADPGIVALLNGRCVPLKVDASRDPYLAQALRVQSYPTLVYASPTGKVHGYREGFLEAPALKAQPEMLLAPLTAPEWMTRDFEEAGKALAKSDYAKALPLLHGVLEDGKDRPVQAKARKLLQELEGQAAERLAKARKLADGGKKAEAEAAIHDL